MLLERYGKLTMWKSKSSRLSYSLVESLPPLKDSANFIAICLRHFTDFDDCLVRFLLLERIRSSILYFYYIIHNMARLCIVCFT